MKFLGPKKSQCLLALLKTVIQDRMTDVRFVPQYAAFSAVSVRELTVSVLYSSPSLSLKLCGTPV